MIYEHPTILIFIERYSKFYCAPLLLMSSSYNKIIYVKILRELFRNNTNHKLLLFVNRTNFCGTHRSLFFSSLPMNTTAFQANDVSKAYTRPLRVFLTTITTSVISGQGFYNSQIGRWHLWHDRRWMETALKIYMDAIEQAKKMWCENCCCRNQRKMASD